MGAMLGQFCPCDSGALFRHCKLEVALSSFERKALIIEVSDCVGQTVRLRLVVSILLIDPKSRQIGLQARPLLTSLSQTGTQLRLAERDSTERAVGNSFIKRFPVLLQRCYLASFSKDLRRESKKETDPGSRLPVGLDMISLERIAEVVTDKLSE